MLGWGGDVMLIVADAVYGECQTWLLASLLGLVETVPPVPVPVPVLVPVPVSVPVPPCQIWREQLTSGTN